MKKVLSIFLALVLCLCACQNQKLENNNLENQNRKLQVYSSFFPTSQFVKMVAQDKVEVIDIIANGEEAHDFELRANDIAKITAADLIVYNGAGLENFIPDLKNAINQDDKFLDLSKQLSYLLSDEKKEINPHTWLSLVLAQEMIEAIKDKLISIDQVNQDFYQSNAIKAQAELNDLFIKYQDEFNQIQKDKYFVTSHAAFNYLAHDFGLMQISVTGLSPEEEPSAKVLAEISDFVKSNKVNTIFFEGSATPKIAQTLAQEANLQVSSVYTMETLSESDANKGYLALMEANLQAILESFK